MREKDIKRILQQPYSFENWKELLPLFFKKVEYLSKLNFDDGEIRYKTSTNVKNHSLDSDTIKQLV